VLLELETHPKARKQAINKEKTNPLSRIKPPNQAKDTPYGAYNCSILWNQVGFGFISNNIGY
jgi:hypothetical protein